MGSDTTPKTATATSAAAQQTLSVSEIAEVGLGVPSDDWAVTFFGLHPIGDQEAYFSYRLNIGRVTREKVVFSPALSRGLPVQTDPCMAPAVDEIRRERSGRLVLTLKDAGSPHFTAGCHGPEVAGVAYVWTDARWVATDLPAWAPSPTRHVFQEAHLGAKTVRLMGPRVVAADDGWNPPEDYEHLSVCFGERRSMLAGWDLPDGLPSLPSDLCVEAIAFGTSGADLLLFGRTQDGAMWLERKAPTTPSTRTRIEIPASCSIRSSSDPTWLGGVDQGDLLVGVSCRKTKVVGDVDQRTFSFHYAWKGGQLAVTPFEAQPESPDAREVVDLGHGFALRRASTKPPPVLVYDPTPKNPPVLLHHGKTVLERASQAIAFGGNAALAEQSGRLVLLRASPPAASVALPPAKIPADSAPEGRFLALPEQSGACVEPAFRFSRVRADEHAQETLERTREALARLVREHPEIASGVEHFVEFRIGDEIFVGRHWSAAQPLSPSAKTQLLQQRVKAWARAQGLEFEGVCIFEYPSGEGRSYRFDASGQMVWIDRARAVRVNASP
jgi:hypothetical protein